MREINFISNDFEKYIKTLLVKTENEKIYDKDINNITEIVINSKNLRGKILDVTIEDLLNFSNLKTCYIKNMKISDIEINYLNQFVNLEKLQLDTCNFQVKKAKLISNIKQLTIVNCYNFNVKIIEDLKQIEALMIKQKMQMKLKPLKKLTTLQKLYLQKIEQLDLSFLKQLFNLEVLNIEKSELKNEMDIERFKGIIKVEV